MLMLCIATSVFSYPALVTLPNGRIYYSLNFYCCWMYGFSSSENKYTVCMYVEEWHWSYQSGLLESVLCFCPLGSLSNVFPLKWLVQCGMKHVFSKFRYHQRWPTGGHFIAWETYFCSWTCTRKIQKIAVLLKIHYYATFLCTFTSYCQISNWAKNGRSVAILLIRNIFFLSIKKL